MSKRDKQGQYARRRSPVFIVMVWLSSILSLGLVYLTAKVAMSQLIAFRSCNGNSNGLTVVSCGKQSLNLGDIVLIALFILAMILSFKLFLTAWRLTSRRLP